ncbi:bifunctional serine/threonine-protein kinase/ABC transporter substrate-binding protein [Streptomyces sp. NPDC089919]|uniref:bifunctional serine/threonine-protein kinase/ABC transporter substrate-binding protein n=1 Tax=Streptomyces sp. NPDC089919 TaxID=3155188 RepID=UPI003427CD03
MRPLGPGDPAVVGGYRLLGRLGAGGMGTVYLARGPGGSLTALKVITAGHARDPGFRQRFRREAEAARGLRGRWLVPVLAADPGAPQPWLATPYVPGPSLAEAVAGYGPLPVAAVRLLGARLAEALAEVHAAGLVHRDVKPGNVLLALDGPRLIDFGIARAAGATTLTAADAVVGTPGYLAPEQARAGGAAGPPADVFALGCLLAFAAGGAPPFGAGHPAGVVFRTVHEEPELDGVPEELRSAVAACLAKEPEARPTPGELRALLGPDPGEGPWLPPALLRSIAARAATALAPTDPEPTWPGGGPGAAGSAPARRRLLLAGGAVALAAGGAGLWALRSGRPAARRRAGRPVRVLAVHADLSGPGAAVGRAQERGARLAVQRYNSRTDAAFRLLLRSADDAGDRARAARVAAELVADPAVLAVLGPSWDGAVAAVAAVCGRGGLPLLLVSAEPGALDPAQAPMLCATRPAAEGLALPLIRYLASAGPVRRTAVVEDLAGGAPAVELTRELRRAPPAEGRMTIHHIAAGAADFRAAACSVVAGRAEGVVYTGTSPARAALLARALGRAGFTGPRAAPQYAMEPRFLRDAGAAGPGWVFSAQFADPLALAVRGAGARAFVRAHEAAYGAPPGRWAVEAHDAVGLVAAALAAAGPAAGRTELAPRLLRTVYQGLAKRLEFAPDTHLLPPARGTYLYRAERTGYRFLGPYPDGPG